MVSLDTVNAAIGQTMPAIRYTFDERDTILYALGVGAPLNPMDKDDLRYVYELHPEFCALPTMPVIYSSKMIDDIVSGNIAGIEFNPMMLVHGEQAIELHKQPPVSGTINCIPTIRNIYDKGSGMLIVTDVTCINEQDDTIAVTTSSMFIRGREEPPAPAPPGRVTPRGPAGHDHQPAGLLLLSEPADEPPP